MLPTLPPGAKEILQTIASAGGQGYVVGGAVRDMLRGKPPQDWDFAATLPTEALLKTFPQARLIGGACGTVQLPFGSGQCEITPCRTEGAYSDKRHPDTVTFTPNILQDLARRDFTVNAMAYNGEILLDPYGGQQDIQRRLLRCVGAPAARFAEDPLRILRLYRFMAQLGFAPEAATYSAAADAMEGLATLPAERVRGEVERILFSAAPDVLGTLVAQGGLRAYGLHFAPAMAPLAQVPNTPLCRWWALCALCGAPTARVVASFGLSRHLARELAECTRLYRAGPARDKTMLKMKLRHTLLDYTDIASTFAAVSPTFLSEPALFLSVKSQQEPFRLAELAVDGDMLARQGLRGEKCGQMLEELLKAVIRNPSLNRRPVLLSLARELRSLL